MSRIPRLRPEQLDERQRAVYADIAGGPRAAGPQLFRLTGDDGALEGPFNAMLLQPALGDALQRLGGAIRYEGALSDRARELAILVVAAHWDSAFERHAHEAVGAHVGLTEAELAAVRTGGDPGLDDPVEAAVVRTARLLTARAGLTDDEYAEAVRVLGPAGLFELTTLVGYYATLALHLRVFGVER
ncbi:carboxymuconolactone decarboxylase family protein [Marinitenerispora sediminis]|uniref:Carboxymuconolactone decarboxylase n=1 Tax=Marinitenerispora sediminis TaxID=1931232 RepID=A0A368SZH7_9ACTN|nr:carboxymuconolactone decarboxylase family protein [Marinitenerispora sediminis]RCV48540.1 carboxymuconolactone decarboxylase [Marinitenerispora sediminis]RCV50260.1 carboxymuconolactone decarboxylase [Marinitenerispora sediminis]RCV51145.1 carboxymuconolactone decarboxylase [Marinitenerispora sediminis]